MRKHPVLILFLLLGIAIFASAEDLVVRMRPKQSQEDMSHDYFTGLAQLALEKTASDYGPARVELISINPTQGRALSELSISNLLDLDWAGTNSEREKKLLPIRIPLECGLLGYRVPVIRRENLPEFEVITTLDELKKYTAVQGSQWPDSDILESAGLKITRVPKFESMYKMLEARRVDYFPRGLNEVYSEVAALSDKDFIAYDSLIIAYKFPMYFFTSPTNKSLAVRIETGLRRAIADGSFLEYMKKSPVTAVVFPLAKYKKSRIIHINNPFLPKETPLKDSSLWLEIGK